MSNVSQKEFLEHCRQNDITAKKLDQLMPLVDLIPTLNEIVEEKKAATLVGKKIIRVIGYTAAIIGILYAIFKFWKEK